jgi:large subunit ribosomal protein L9
MEIILTKDVAKLGSANDVVKVKNGYATNYLIPQGFAMQATTPALKQRAETLKQRAHKEEKIKQEAQDMAQRLTGIVLTIYTKVGATGKIYGSVNTLQIADQLKKQGFDVDRKQISINEELVKEIGTYEAEIKLHRDVKATFSFEVKAEE